MPRGAAHSPRTPGLLLRAALWAIALLAPAAVLVTLWTCAVDVPRWDEWEFAEFVAAWATGSAGWERLFEQYNDHRMAVPRLVILFFSQTTGWNLRAQAFVAPLLAALTVVLLARIGGRHVGTFGGRWLAATAVTSLAVFSPVQDENWMMGLQHAFFVPGLCLAGIMAIAGTGWSSWPRWFAAAVLAVVATLTVSSGFLLWVCAVPALWWLSPPGRERRLAGLVGWIACAGLTAWLFSRDYVSLSTAQAWVNPVRDAGRFWGYAFAFLGAPFARGTGWSPLWLATLVGVVHVAAFGLLSWRAVISRDRRRSAVPWIVLGLFAIASAAAGSELRSGLGQEQALSSRYATFSLMLLVAITWLLVTGPDSRRFHRSARTAGAVLITASVTLLGLSSARALGEMAELSREVRAARAALPFVGQVPDTEPLTILYLYLDKLPSLADRLWATGRLRPPKRADAFLPTSSDAGTDIDSGRLECVTVGGDRVSLSGWATVPTRSAPADLVALAVHANGGPGRVVSFGLMHADEDWPEPGAAGTGRRTAAWRATLTRSSLPADATVLSAWALDADTGRAFRLGGACDLATGEVR